VHWVWTLPTALTWLFILGCTVAAWYPITPSSSLCEAFISYSDKYRTDPNTGERKVAIIQAEDELAAIGMVFGATWAGARAMTSTSGPGLSLMAEYAGLGYFAELPGVIFDVQRAGPSTGLPTARPMINGIAIAGRHCRAGRSLNSSHCINQVARTALRSRTRCLAFDVFVFIQSSLCP